MLPTFGVIPPPTLHSKVDNFSKNDKQIYTIFI